MRRIAFVLSGMLLLSVGVGGMIPTAVAGPPPDGNSTGRASASTGFPGATVEPLAGGPPAQATGYALSLVRVTLAPGAALPPLRHPGTVAAYVASGSFVVTVIAGEFDITRSESGAVEAAAIGREVVLHAGDAAVDHGSVHRGRNPGATPTVLLISGLIAAGEPFVVPVPTDDGGRQPAPGLPGEPY